jgi:hypothetical protein
VGLAHADIVGEEDHIEFSALGGFCDFGVMREVDAGVGLRAVMPPGGNMMAGWIEKGAEPELCFGPRHECSSLRGILPPLDCGVQGATPFPIYVTDFGVMQPQLRGGAAKMRRRPARLTGRRGSLLIA